MRLWTASQEWLSEWERDLDEQPETMKRTAQGRVTIAMFKQTQRFLQPLLRALHQRTLAEDLVQLIHEIVLHIVERNYIAANESYLKLAIGNAPWPMGVTCVRYIANPCVRVACVKFCVCVLIYCCLATPPSWTCRSASTSARHVRRLKLVKWRIS